MFNFGGMEVTKEMTEMFKLKINYDRIEILMGKREADLCLLYFTSGYIFSKGNLKQTK